MTAHKAFTIPAGTKDPLETSMFTEKTYKNSTTTHSPADKNLKVPTGPYGL